MTSERDLGPQSPEGKQHETESGDSNPEAERVRHAFNRPLDVVQRFGEFGQRLCYFFAVII